jgi:hypothetical protein
LLRGIFSVIVVGYGAYGKAIQEEADGGQWSFSKRRYLVLLADRRVSEGSTSMKVASVKVAATSPAILSVRWLRLMGACRRNLSQPAVTFSDARDLCVMTSA